MLSGEEDLVTRYVKSRSRERRVIARREVLEKGEGFFDGVFASRREYLYGVMRAELKK